MSKLEVHWFRPWHPILDEALKDLPEEPGCPHELLRLLAQNPGPLRKETALVMHDGEPVAVIPLRRMVAGHWEPITLDVCARSLAPARPGLLAPAMRATGREIACWGTTDRPIATIATDVRADPIHVVDLQGDYEEYWAEMANRRSVQGARKKTADYQLIIDDDASTVWAIMGARQNYGGKYLVSDDSLAAQFLAPRGRFQSLALADGDEFLAAMTFHLVPGGPVVWMHSWANPEYRSRQVGVRILDAACHYMADAGHGGLDLRSSAGFAYKARWAPATDAYWAWRVRPLHVTARQQGRRAMRRVAASVRRVVSRPVAAGS